MKDCYGIVDSNVDKLYGGYTYIDEAWKCPCKISACLTIILFELLGFASRLSTSWESFETVCVLAQVQDTVLRTSIKEKFDLIKMRTPFPASGAVRRAKVPIIKQNDVVVNGPRALQGNVFSKNVIVQSEHSVNHEEVECNLMDELYKSGLAKYDNDELVGGASVHAAVTALLYQQWNRKGFDKKKRRSGDTSRPQLSKTSRTFMYPASLLEANEVANYSLLEIVKVASTGRKQGDDDDDGFHSDEVDKWKVGATVIDIPKQFDQTITLVICTNARSIKLKLQSVGDYQDSQSLSPPPTGFTVTLEHVNGDGALLENGTSQLKDWITQNAKGGVEVRFHFCRAYNYAGGDMHVDSD